MKINNFQFLLKIIFKNLFVILIIIFTSYKLGLGSSVFPVIPGGCGYGIDTPAGRGGKIFRVTNLNSWGKGSLRECLWEEGPRVCIFEVSGYINLERDLLVKNPFLTIAGQTAPSPGVTIRGAAIFFATHDVLVQHLRFRLGTENKNNVEGDAIAIVGKSHKSDNTSNIVLDHVSASWGWDETISTWSEGVGNVTISNSIISEGLDDSIHPYGKHSNGLIIGPFHENILIYRNLFAHNNHRNPYLKGKSSTAVINNIIYNPSYRAIQLEDGEGFGTIKSSIIGNVLVEGPDTEKNMPFLQVKNGVRAAEIYLKDNLMVSLGKDNLRLLIENMSNKNVIHEKPTIDLSEVNIISAKEVLENVLKNVGARPTDRDLVDIRIISNVKNKGGYKINCVDNDNSERCKKNAGGWPELKKNYRELYPPKNPNRDDDGDGYTNLENWLNNFSESLLIK